MKIRLTMQCLSGFELYSGWVPLSKYYFDIVGNNNENVLRLITDYLNFAYEQHHKEFG